MNHKHAALVALLLTLGTVGSTQAAPSAEFPTVALQRAVAHRSAGDLRLAAAELAQLAQTWPRQRDVQFELATTLAWRHELAAALTIYRKLAAADANDLSAAIAVARILGWQEQHAEARQLLRDILARQPSNVEALTTLGNIELAALQRDAAQQAFVRAVQLAPANADAHAGLQRLPAANRWALRLGAEYRRGPAVYTADAGLQYRWTPRTTLLAEGGRTAPQPGEISTAAIDQRIAAGVSHRGQAIGGAVLCEALWNRKAAGVLVSAESHVARVRFGAMGRMRSDGNAPSYLGNLWAALNVSTRWSGGVSLYGSRDGGRNGFAVRLRSDLVASARVALQFVAERRGDTQLGAGGMMQYTMDAGHMLRASVMTFPQQQETWLSLSMGLSY